MATGDVVWRLGRRPALDGVRGVAILLVLVGHSWDAQLGAAGRVGVSVFFVLSGFLITALLLEERDRVGRIALGAFFARRAVRLLPALYVFLLVVAVLSPVWGGAAPDGWGYLGALLYVGNWLPVLGHDLGPVIGHTWSLAVEEQFYLLWPLVLTILWRLPWRLQLVGCLAVAGASLLWRATLFDAGSWAHAYVGTDVNARALVLGAGIAVVARETTIAPGRVPVLAAGGLLAVLALVRQPDLAWLVAPGLAPFAAAVLVLAAARSELRPLTGRFLVHAGRRSYGLYLWHAPLLLVVAPSLPGPTWAGVAVMLPASWVLAALSWRLVEAPALRLLRNAQDHHRRVVGVQREAGARVLPGPHLERTSARG